MFKEQVGTYGIFKCMLINKKTGKVEKEIEKKNHIVKSSFDIFYNLLAKGESASRVGVIALGMGGIDNNEFVMPTDGDIALSNETFRKSITSTEKINDDLTTANDDSVVLFKCRIDSDEGNLGGGTIFNEAGLYSADGTTLFSHVVFETIFKSSDFIIDIEWKIAWQVDNSDLRDIDYPVISGVPSFTLSENTPPKKLGVYTARWNDDKDTFTLNDPTNSFELKNETSTTIELWSKKSFDYESDPNAYLVEIKAKNAKGYESVFPVKIDILDVDSGLGEIPPVINDGNFSIEENQPIGSTVGVVSFQANTSQGVSFILDDDTNFSIDENGIINYPIKNLINVFISIFSFNDNYQYRKFVLIFNTMPFVDLTLHVLYISKKINKKGVYALFS